MRKNKENFLDFIPVCNPGYAWEKDKNGNVVVCVVNKGFYHWIAQTFFKRPRISHIRLDRYGSFIWRQIDGRRNVYDISRMLKTQFGEEAEPLLERLVPFVQILYQNKFIGYVKP